MIEKKTEIEIINESLDNIKDTSRKVWISEDSLIEWLKLRIKKPMWSCQDCKIQLADKQKREFFEIILKELEKVKENE